MAEQVKARRYAISKLRKNASIDAVILATRQVAASADERARDIEADIRGNGYDFGKQCRAYAHRHEAQNLRELATHMERFK